MARVEITSAVTGGGGGGGGNLQLSGGASMSATLTAVTDTSNVASPLKLSTTAVQVVSPLRITTSDASGFYLDAEDSATNNRFSIKRDPSSQVVTLDFASNPTGTTDMVGAIRTYVDGVNLSEAMTFREDGNVGIGTTNPTARLRVISADTNGIAEFFQNGNTAAPLHLTRYGGNVPINLNTSGGTSTSPVPVGDNIQMSRITTNTYNGTAFGTSARIEVLSKGIQSATNYGSVMRFLTTPENATSMNEVMSLTSDGNVQIGIGYLVAGGAKLAIKGSGSTSATSSLLVQNSGGSVALEVLDDSRVKLGSSADFTVYSGSGITSRFSMNVGSTSLATSSAILQVTSTTQGFLPPRMTDAERAAIASPAEGLLIYNTDNHAVAYRDGTNWGYLCGALQNVTGAGGTQNILFASGNIVNLTLNASTTLTFAGHVVGTYIIQVTQGGAGSNTLTYPASVKWSGGTPPTLTTAVGKTDILTFYHDGTNFFGTYSLNY